MGFPPNPSPPGVLGQGGCVIPFWNREDKEKKVGSGILIVSPGPKKTGPEGRAGRGRPKFWNFNIFLKRDPRRWSLFVYATF